MNPKAPNKTKPMRRNLPQNLHMLKNPAANNTTETVFDDLVSEPSMKRNPIMESLEMRRSKNPANKTIHLDMFKD